MIKKDVRSLSLEDLRAFFTDKGFQAFRGNQVYEWLWKKSITDIDQMTNISKEIRDLKTKRKKLEKEVGELEAQKPD